MNEPGPHWSAHTHESDQQRRQKEKKKKLRPNTSSDSFGSAASDRVREARERRKQQQRQGGGGNVPGVVASKLNPREKKKKKAEGNPNPVSVGLNRQFPHDKFRNSPLLSAPEPPASNRDDDDDEEGEQEKDNQSDGNPSSIFKDDSGESSEGDGASHQRSNSLAQVDALEASAPLLEATLVTNSQAFAAETTRVQEVFVAQPAIEDATNNHKSCLPRDNGGRLLFLAIVLVLAGVAVTGILCGSGLCSASTSDGDGPDGQEDRPAPIPPTSSPTMLPPSVAPFWAAPTTGPVVAVVPTSTANNTNAPSMKPTRQPQTSNIFEQPSLAQGNRTSPAPSEMPIEAGFFDNHTLAGDMSSSSPTLTATPTTTSSPSRSPTTNATTIRPSSSPSQSPTTDATTTIRPSSSPTFIPSNSPTIVATATPTTAPPTSNLDPVWLDLLRNTSQTITTEVDLAFAEPTVTGTIPTQVGLQSDWLRLDLGHNHVSGTIPTQLGLLTQLTYLGLHANALSGTIPSELALLASLPHLALYSNQLSGRIPSQLGVMTNIVALMLWENKLSGTVPESVCRRTLAGGNLAVPEDFGPGPYRYDGLSIDCPSVVCPQEDCVCSCIEEEGEETAVDSSFVPGLEEPTTVPPI